MRCVLLALVLVAHALIATPVTIQNAGFETGNLTQVGNGTFSQLINPSTVFAPGGTLDSWTATSTTSAAAAGGFAPSAGGVNWTTNWWTGNNIGYLQIGSPGTVALAQVLTTNLLDDTVYTLNVDLGRRTFTPTFACSIQLLAGSTVLNSSACPALASNSSGAQSVVYNSGSSNALAGQALQIRLSITDTSTQFDEAFFDNVRLDAVTTGQNSVPEPASCGLIGVGFLALALLRRK